MKPGSYILYLLYMYLHDIRNHSNIAALLKTERLLRCQTPIGAIPSSASSEGLAGSLDSPEAVSEAGTPAVAPPRRMWCVFFAAKNDKTWRMIARKQLLMTSVAPFSDFVCRRWVRNGSLQSFMMSRCGLAQIGRQWQLPSAVLHEANLFSLLAELLAFLLDVSDGLFVASTQVGKKKKRLKTNSPSMHNKSPPVASS